MKSIFIIATFVCWSALSGADDIYVSPEFPNNVNESLLKCEDNVLSINFANAVISKIGPNFISSPLITCLDLRSNSINNIAKDAFSKLSSLTDLYLSDNKLDSSRNLFTFGGHQTLKVLVLNNAVTSSVWTSIEIPGLYPNLEILSARRNGFTDLTSPTSNQTIPFPKLKVLDLSSNNMNDVKFMKLLPKNLTHLYLQYNSLQTLSPRQKNLIALNLDRNNFAYVRRYSNNPYEAGLWTISLDSLRYLSMFKNKIHNIESIAFRDTKLIHLNLSTNNIERLYPETFAKLPLLKTLDLNCNKFQTVPEISSETNITVFFLIGNKIKKITEGAFARMPKLRELSLSGNQIDEIGVHGFAYLYHLEKLDLSSNKLSSLPKGWTAAFRSLRYLDLSDNQFATLESLSLTNTLPLVEIYLAMNPLKYLDAKSLESLPRNATVDLVYRSRKSALC